MDAALREKLFNPDTSEEERDVICNVAFGKSFEESLREIRYDDFVEGVGNGFYRILSAMVKSGSMVKSRRGTNESESMVREIEIKFMCQGAFDLTAMSFMYSSDGPAFSGPDGPFPFGTYITFARNFAQPITFWFDIYSEEIDERLRAALLKQETNYMMPSGMLCNMLSILREYNIKDEKKKETASSRHDRRARSGGIKVAPCAQTAQRHA